MVSLQWGYAKLEDALPPHLFEAMNCSPPNWYWLMRFHPIQSGTKKQQIIETLESHGIKNYNTHYASTCPLPALLKRTHHHLTCLSSVGYEAAAFRIPTTIIHPKGLQLFESEINQGIFTYADHCEMLLNVLRQEFSKERLHQLTSLAIQTDQEHAEIALKLILGKVPHPKMKN